MKLSEKLAQIAAQEAHEIEPQAEKASEAKDAPELERPARPSFEPQAAVPEDVRQDGQGSRRASIKPPPRKRPPVNKERQGSTKLRSVGFQARALDELKARVRVAVVKELGPRLASGAVDETTLKARLEHHLGEQMRSSSITVGPSERTAFFNEVLADMLGWGPLEQLMDDPDVTEIMCNAHDEVWVERNGVIERTQIKFSSVAAYRQVIDRMLAVAGRRIDEAQPMADGRLADGSRINAIIPPLVVGEPVLTVRRFPEMPFTVTDLIRLESLSKDAAVFLEAAVRGKLNIVVSGGTGTGKTTLLNVLSNYIPEHERVITIEDAAELRLSQPHVVRLEARPANIEGAGQVTIRDLVRNALRMRPDRIVVGEVRGGEALDMLQAMNTGHEGSLTTVHANSARDALARIETMVLFSGVDLPLRAVREQIASSLDLVVQLSRRSDGRRVVERIVEIQGREGDTITMQDVFARSGGGPLKATGLRPKVLDEMGERGVTVPPAVFRSTARPEAVTGRRAR